MKAKKKRSPLRRVLRGIAWLIAVFIAFHIAAGIIPFLRLPPPDAAMIELCEARADEMQFDHPTGDRAAILETSLSALDERMRLIARAEREVVIVTYECHDGESTRDILAAALDRADAGVRVRFLVDGIAGRLDHMDADLFRAVASHPNVEVRFYNLITQYTPWKHMGRMHDKYVIADDFAYILGGRNMFDKFIGDYPSPIHSLDREALVFNSDDSQDSSLFALREYFEGMWDHPETRAFDPKGRISDERRDAVYDELRQRWADIRRDKPELFEPVDYLDFTEPTGGVWLVSNPTTIYAKQPGVFTQLATLMRRAEKDVVIHSPYAVLNRDMEDALRDIAARVPVTLMVNAVGTGANVVASGDYLYHRNEVLSTGVRLLEKCLGDSYHGKAIAIDDDLSIIGSFNLDMRSAYVDTELMLVIQGASINARLRRHMETLHADCREVTHPGQSLVPESAEISRVPWWKLAMMYALGAVLQPVRNLL